jgi:hypothetical protein
LAEPATLHPVSATTRYRSFLVLSPRLKKLNQQPKHGRGGGGADAADRVLRCRRGDTPLFAHPQRKPKNDSAAKTMTTKPTSQMTLFMILCLRVTLGVVNRWGHAVSEHERDTPYGATSAISLAL